MAVRSPELGLVQSTNKLNTSLVAFSPVGRGLLTDSPHSEEDIQSMDFLKQIPRFQSPNLAANLRITNRFRAFAKSMGKPAASIAIAWLLQSSPNIITIPGTRSRKHLQELALGSSIVLSESELHALNDILPVGWAHGDRYSQDQWLGPERYC